MRERVLAAKALLAAARHWQRHKATPPNASGEDSALEVRVWVLHGAGPIDRWIVIDRDTADLGRRAAAAV
jgi:hypothetical protein